MKDITLSYSDMLIAAQAGLMRRIENVKKGNVSNKSPYDNKWQTDIEGALAEYALAKAIGRFWWGKGNPRDPDVYPNEECRHSESHENRLILHKTDHDTRRYWLVTGRDGKYRVHGYILGRDGKKEEYWADPTGKNFPAFFIPQNKLVTEW